MTDGTNSHGQWSSRWTFILAATGSAVGLGNIWKFPYMAGESGGAVFVLVYLFCIGVLGIPVMIAEVLLGRAGRQSPVNTMKSMVSASKAGSGWISIGWMGISAGVFILAFYSVIAGWAMYYTVLSVTGAFATLDAQSAGSLFAGFVSQPFELVYWHSAFMILTVGVVMTGVKRGLAMVARFLMPLLFVMLAALLVYAMMQDAFKEAFVFLFQPRLEQFTWESILNAMGHAFFTLSLGMGAIMAYGSYMPAKASIAKTVFMVGFLDTLVAIVSGLIIFSVVFAQGLNASSGPGLLFQSLPIAFGSMEGGLIIGSAFFILVCIAAWSSAVSLIEPAIAWLAEKPGLTRVRASIIVGVLTWALGIFVALSFNLLQDFSPWFLLNKNGFDFLDFLTSKIMLPLGGLLIALFVGYRLAPSIRKEQLAAQHNERAFTFWLFMVRYVSPVLVAMVMVFFLYEALFS